MLKKLHIKLTLFSAALTGIIVLAVCIMAFVFARRQYLAQCTASFTAAMSEIEMRWEQNKSLDFVYLSKAQANYSVIFYLEDNGNPLKFAEMNKNVEEQAKIVQKYAAENYDVKQIGLLFNARENQSAIFNMYLAGGEFRCFVKNIAATSHSITAMQSLQTEKEYLFKLMIFYALIAVTALLLDAAMCWIVADKAIAPSKKAAKEQEDFMLSVSHELRTPLAIILASTGAIIQNSSRTTEYLHIINEKANQMGELLSDLLLLFSQKKVGFTIRKDLIEIDTFIVDCVEGLEPIANQNHVTLRFNLLSDNFKKIYADANRLRQVIDILTTNALRFAPTNSEIVFSVKQESNGIIIKVSDTGQGIADKEKKKVFHKFYKGSEQTDANHFGLGLAIANEIINLHQGHLYIEDTIPHGCTVVIDLPEA